MGLARVGVTGLYTVCFYFLRASVVWSAVLVWLRVAPRVREGAAVGLIG